MGLKKDNLFAESFEPVARLSEDLIIVVCNDASIRYLNPSCENFFHVDEKEMIGKSANELIVGLDLAELEQHKSTVKCAEKNVEWQRLSIPSRVQGEQLIVLYGRPIAKSLDVSSHLALSGFLGTIMENIPGNFYWKDKLGNYLGCNKLLLQATGLASVEEIVGKTDYDLWPLDADEIRKHDQLAMDRKEPINLEECVEIHGVPRWFAVVKVPLLDDSGEVVGVLGNSLDITFEKKAKQLIEKEKEKAEEANQAKSEFLAMMTHELRTPLNVILGMTQIMQTEECDRDKQLDLLQTIFNSGKSLLGLINDILDFSKAQAGKLQVTPEPFELLPLLHQLQKEFTVKGRENDVAYKVQADPELPRYLLADGQRLRQIIYNLSDNALKFTHDGQVTVFVDKVPAKQVDHIGLSIRVQDTGLGIPEEKLHSVFDEFTQVNSKQHTEYSRRYGGVGLGLAIVRQLISLMHASISVESELGVGTTFTCEFEFALPSEEQMEELRLESEASDDSIKPLNASKVLLVEDNLLNQRVAIHMLGKHNCQVDVANDGAEALAKMKSPYDIVFMDMTLPDMSGIEVTEVYRADEPANQHLPIVALTANAHEDDREACLAAGMDDFLTKPIMLDELYQLLKQYIGVER